MAILNPNSVALITASSAGLGAATSRAFASSGVRVVVNYHSSPGKAIALVEELSQLDSSRGSASTAGSNAEAAPRFMAIGADVSQRSELQRLVAECVAAMGRLDVVVSNHGWTRMRDFQNLDDNVEESDWDVCFNMNVKSHLFLFHAARDYLEATEGAFITTASLAGVIPSGSSLAYSVTKAAQIHMVKALAKIAGSKIRINSVSPGILLTDWGKLFDPEKVEKAVSKSTLHRLATVEDVAQQIICFANSRSICGTNVVIDAGFSLS